MPVAIVVSRGKATLHELETVYSAEDMYDLLEIIKVDDINDAIVTNWQRKKG